ncbi:MAG TPA: hypothetical protein VFE57_05525, partial [Cyclobacteriaceae bacterium]|nr:hypothetical protein [Cyclobacteriaceae bacterium]
PVDSVDVKGITGPVTLQKKGDVSAKSISNWRMKGGVDEVFNKSGWKPLNTNESSNSPRFYKAQFVVSLSDPGSHPIWRVITTGLGHGSVWINGHNLGRYPEKIKINGLYIPENWLNSGTNTVIIYDEDGARPDKVAIEAETAASRDVLIFKSKK